MNPTCHFCKEECNDECFCHGCHNYVCEECDHTLASGHGHDVEDHQLAEQEDTFDELDFNS